MEGSSAQVIFRGAVLGFYRAEPFCLEENFGLVCRSSTACPARAEPLGRIHGFGNTDGVLSSKKKFAQLAGV